MGNNLGHIIFLLDFGPVGFIRSPPSGRSLRVLPRLDTLCPVWGSSLLPPITTFTVSRTWQSSFTTSSALTQKLVFPSNSYPKWESGSSRLELQRQVVGFLLSWFVFKPLIFPQFIILMKNHLLLESWKIIYVRHKIGLVCSTLIVITLNLFELIQIKFSVQNQSFICCVIVLMFWVFFYQIHFNDLVFWHYSVFQNICKWEISFIYMLLKYLAITALPMPII